MLFRILLFLYSFNLYAHDFAIPIKGKILPVHTTLTGKKFLEYFKGHLFYKRLNTDDVHYGFSYSKHWKPTKDGTGYLVTQSRMYFELGDLVPEGHSFTDAIRIKNFLGLGDHFRTVTIRDEDSVYVNEGIFIVNKIILSREQLSLEEVEENVKEVLEGLDLSERDFGWADLRWANLEGADLTRANLKGAYIENLTRANLTKANLTEAYLTRANLTGADLTEANLTNANLLWANLAEANLAEANLKKANLARANLARANLKKANLEETNLEEANLEEANLEEANLKEANLKEANLKKANLKKANLKKANLEEANLKKAKLSGAKGVNKFRLWRQNVKR